MPDRGRILVIRGGAIGDFILTLPALSALRRHFPETHLEVLGYPHVASLAVLGGVADSVHSIESGRLAGYFGRPDTLDTDWGDYFSEFDVIFSYLYDPDGLFQTNIACVSSAQYIRGPHRPKEDVPPRHATDQLLVPLERLAIFGADPVPRLRIRSGERGSWLAVHPGSGSDKKNWPESSWRMLLESVIANTGLGIRIIGGEAEGARLERLARTLPVDRCEVIRSRPLGDVAVLLASSVGFVGHDSGISHLGAAVGLPGLLLWGPTSEAVWRPRGDRITTVRHSEGLMSLAVEVVWARLMEELPVWEALLGL